MFGFGHREASADALDMLVAVLTLGVMVALNVWGRGAARLFCVLIGMAAGYAITALLGRFHSTDLAILSKGALVAFPDIGHIGWAFDPTLALPFAVAAVAATLKVIGNVTTCQKANDADWVRADMRSISRGVLADGLGSVVAGGCGAFGLNSSTAAVGLAGATGVLSRHVAYWVAALLVALAFVPKLGLFFYVMPAPVAGAALVFSSTFILVNGLEIITSRLFDARRTFVIGLALMSGLAIDIYPALLRKLSDAWPTILGTSLVFGTIMGLLLNLVFRIGVRRVEGLTVQHGAVDPVAIERFMDEHGAIWGARRDVMERAKFNVCQSVETIMEACDPKGPLEIQASFDEFSLDVRVSYLGEPLVLPQKRPTNEEIMESEDGQRRLAGFLLRRYADRVSSTHRGGRSLIVFHFDH
jgi:NCS2 family nucleobase:cation symporter-2